MVEWIGRKRRGYNLRALVEADIGRWKRVIGEALHAQTDGRQATDVAIAVNVLTACWSWDARIIFVSYETDKARYYCVQRTDPCNKVAVSKEP